MTYLSEDELDEIVEAREASPVEFSDNLIYLETGSVLISRIITNIKESDEMIVMFEPAELVPTYEGVIMMNRWLAESDDQYFFLPPTRVITMANPKPEILKAYLDVIGVSKNSYLPSNVVLH